MFTEKRLARKRAANERLKLISECNEIEFTKCRSCEMFKDQRESTIKCKGCPSYVRLKEIGETLSLSTSKKRVDVFEVEELRHDTTPENPEVYIKCITSYKDRNGYDFIEGHIFTRSDSFEKSRIKIQDSTTKSINISSNMYYSKFVQISKEERESLIGELKREDFEVIKSFKTRCGRKFEIGEVWTIDKKIWQEKKFKMIKDGEQFLLSIDSFYRNFEKLEEENK